MKLILKLFSYGLAFLFFKWQQSRRHAMQETENSEQQQQQQQELQQQLQSPAPLLLEEVHGEDDNHVTTKEGDFSLDSTESDSSQRALSSGEDQLQHRTFLSGPDVEVHVVTNFLPVESATRWRDTLSHEWQKQQQQINEEKGENPANIAAAHHGGGAWKYTTNNDGTSIKSPHNQKTRSLENITKRNETAQLMYRMNLFSYSKWELDSSHPLVSEIERTFVRKDIMDRVKRIILSTSRSNTEDTSTSTAATDVQLSPQLSDLFVTHFSTGDFLSPHNDGASGTWAIVVSLMDGPSVRSSSNNNNNNEQHDKDWQDDFGGMLRFSCPRSITRTRSETNRNRWCEEIRPAFNTALIFRTRPAGPYHEVTPVSWRAAEESFRRFGVTGWYMERTDVMDSATETERDKMRARDL